MSDQVRARYGDEFRRAWELYLVGSEAAFAVGSLQLFQVVFAPMETPPPYWTRAEIYRHGGTEAPYELIGSEGARCLERTETPAHESGFPNRLQGMPGRRPGGRRSDQRGETTPRWFYPLVRGGASLMLQCDALIVGGGPAGSTCARVLMRAGWNVVVLDRAAFPRDKVCAGWVTPGVFDLLELDPAEYRTTGLTIQPITGFRVSVIGRRSVETRYARVVSYAIRRCEFDDFLLRRSGAHVIGGTPLKSLARHGDVWIANDAISAPIVVGAGGHFCPVARHLRGGTDAVRPVVAKEAEFRLGGDAGRVAGDTPELFFCEDLEGYGWCVRKGEYLNVGLGRRDHGDLNPQHR